MTDESTEKLYAVWAKGFKTPFASTMATSVNEAFKKLERVIWAYTRHDEEITIRPFVDADK